MMDILKWELRQRRTALLWWSVGSLLLVIVIMGLYPSIRDQAKQLNQVINQLPSGLRGLKTGGASSVNVADPIAFLNSQIFYATLPILWIILSVTRGSAVLGREEQNHTLELLLARPVKRGGLLLAKALSLVGEFVIVGGVTLLAVVFIAPAFGLHVGTSKLMLATVYTAAVSLSFGLIAFTLQAASQKTRKIATAAAVFIGFGGYLISSLSSMTDWLKIPAKFAPFHYFAPDKIMHGDISAGLNGYLVGVLVFTVLVSYIGFRRRDIE